MAPEERAAVAELARLRREVAEDRRAMQAHAGTLVELRPRWQELVTTQRKPTLALAAVALHSWYTALETALERSLRTIDGGTPAGDASHRMLLSRAMTELPNVRPAVLPAALTAELLGLLTFRHFFRHAYAVELDADKILREVDRLLDIHGQVEAALDAFDAFLVQAERRAAGS